MPVPSGPDEDGAGRRQERGTLAASLLPTGRRGVVARWSRWWRRRRTAGTMAAIHPIKEYFTFIERSSKYVLMCQQILILSCNLLFFCHYSLVFFFCNKSNVKCCTLLHNGRSESTLSTLRLVASTFEDDMCRAFIKTLNCLFNDWAITTVCCWHNGRPKGITLCHSIKGMSEKKL